MDRGARWLGKSSRDLTFSTISTGKWMYVCGNQSIALCIIDRSL
jgi:hypothetical protein